MSIKLSLVVTTAGKAQGQVIPIKFAQFVIGRDAQCNLRPASALISKRHCAILVKNGGVYVRDFDSTNGTFVNEEPVKGEVPLHHDDVLKVGPLAFKVNIEGQASISKPTPPPKAAAAADDDAAAALLLGLQDEGEAGGAGGGADDANVPAGSTVFDLPSPVTGTSEGPAADPNKKPDPRKPEKPTAASASKAAESLLAKYTRRQR
jgi:pSer/pThr/pTyr-binding forkhead associated (FHA) protein